MVRDRSSDVSAAYRKLMREDTPGEKLVRVWIWEYVLKFTSDARLIRELTESLSFPKDVPRLKLMILLKELANQVGKGFAVVDDTLNRLEALLHSSRDEEEGGAGEEAGPAAAPDGGGLDGFAGGRRKRFRASHGDVQKGKVDGRGERCSENGDEPGKTLAWKGIEQSFEGLKEELHLLRDLSADGNDFSQKSIVEEVERKLNCFIVSAWAALGPAFLEKTEVAIRAGLHKPGGSLQLPASVSGQTTGRELAGEEVIPGKSRNLENARHALAQSCAELKKVVKDPLPALLRKLDGGAEPPPNTSGKEQPNAGPAVKRSLLDPHPSAQAQGWDEEEEIEESPPDNSPSASGRVRLPPMKSPTRPAGEPPAPPTTAEAPVTVAHLNKRQRKRWSEVEVETLKREVRIYGKGRWKLILQKNFHVLHGRTEVDLKDKWRNLEKYEGIKI